MGVPDSRGRLLECALKQFSRDGYDAVGIQEIVEAAGVTKPSLYHYFHSKLGLLTALVAERFAPFDAKLEAAAEYRHDVTRTLSEIARAYFAFAQEDEAFYRLQLSLWFAPTHSDGFKAISGHHERQFGLVAEVFRQAARDHGNMKGRERAYAASFLGMLNNYAALFLNGYLRLDERTVQRAVHQFMHGIFS